MSLSRSRLHPLLPTRRGWPAPIGSIHLIAKGEDEEHWWVLDGKQRLHAIKLFVEGRFAVPLCVEEGTLVVPLVGDKKERGARPMHWKQMTASADDGIRRLVARFLARSWGGDRRGEQR